MDTAAMQACLAAAEEHIKKAEDRIRKQEERAKRFLPGSLERQQAEAVLKDLRELKPTMEKHREIVSDVLFRNELWIKECLLRRTRVRNAGQTRKTRRNKGRS
jgi:hypothetical protein